MRTRSRPHTVCLLLVACRDAISESEASAFAQYGRILPDVPVVLVVADTVSSRAVDLRARALGRQPRVVRIHRSWLASHAAYNALCLEPWFYRMFKGYEYMFFAQGDGWVTCDALDWWTSRECDYIAPPYFVNPRGVFLSLQERHGGNGGMCLRRTEAFIRFTEALKTHNINARWCWEDQVFSGALPYHQRKVLPSLAYFPYTEQARFGWTNAGECGHEAKFLLRVTGGVLPMAIHKPTSEFYSRFCVPDVPPKDIFMFSSVAGGDYLAAVNRVNSDPSTRLLVGFNKNDALLKTVSGKALVEQGNCNLLTVHNETVERFQGFAGRAETVLGVLGSRFNGRHRMICLRWRTPENAADISATYDGEIAAARETEVLKSITVSETAPTAGYMGYRIIRDRYPDARIHLVNFLGGSKRHPVCYRHDTGWEQRDYRKDRKVDFINTVE